MKEREYVYLVIDCDDTARFCVCGIWFNRNTAIEFAESGNFAGRNLEVLCYPMEDFRIDENISKNIE